MKFKKTLLVSAISASLVNSAFAAEPVRLETTKVGSEAKKPTAVQSLTLDSETVDKQSITSIEDTARYISGVQVNDTGNRFGNDGFNIRGLEGDAVAVTVDGLSQGETLNPDSFASYGMYGSSRGEVEIEHVKSIQITKGPNSVLNGNGALAGSVAYVTKDAADFLREQGDTTAGRLKVGFDARSDEFLASVGIANRTGGLESLLMYTRRDGNEAEAFGNGADVTGADRGLADPMDITTDSILFKAAYNLNDDHRLGVVYEKTDRETDGEPLSRESSSYWNFKTYDENNRERFGVFYDWNNANTLMFDSLSVTVDYQELESAGLTQFLFSDPAYLRQEDRGFDQEATVVHLDFSKAFNYIFDHNLVYGLSYDSTTAESYGFDRRYNGETVDSGFRNGYPVNDTVFVPKTDKDAYSLYIREDITINEQLSAFAGLRYDDTEYSPTTNDDFTDITGKGIKDSSFSAFAYELGMSYKLAPGHVLMASVGKGYKAPTTQELYLGTDSSEIVTDMNTGINYEDLGTIANPDLDAEESVNYELTYKFETDRVRLSATAFWTKYTNMIQNETFANPYGTEVTVQSCGRFGCATETLTEDQYFQPHNAGEVDVDGIEIDARWLLTDNVIASFTYSIIDGEYQTASATNNIGDDLETAAPDSATVGLSYLSDAGNWGTELFAVMSKGVDESEQLSFTSLNNGSGPVYYPGGYTVFDLNGFYDITENLRVTATIYNLLDKEYYRWEVMNGVREGTGGFFGGASAQGNGDGYQRFSEAGRSVSAYITYTF